MTTAGHSSHIREAVPVDWEDGSSRALAFNAAQFPDGRIVVLGHYGSDNPFSWFGGGDEPEPIKLLWRHARRLDPAQRGKCPGRRTICRR